MRKRINISIDEATYGRLSKIKEAYGFRSICELAAASLGLLVQYVEAAGERADRAVPSAEDEISEMFNDLGAWEQTPQSVVPPALRHTRNK